MKLTGPKEGVSLELDMWRGVAVGI